MSVYAGTGRLSALSTSPPSPPAGYCLIYFKDDNILYIKDSSGIETPIGTSAGIASLIGDVVASGPGVATAVVAFVGGKTAAEIAASVNDTQAATSTNTPNTLVERDGSGNFTANIITASLTGLASGNVAKTGDTMSGDLNLGGNQIKNMAAPSLGGDATNKTYVDNADNLKFDKSGGTITGAVSITDTSPVALVVDGDVFVVDASNNRIGINKLNPVEALDVVGNAQFSGTILASNFNGSLTGTNTGDVTVLDTNSIDFTLTGQQIQASVRRADTTIDEIASGIRVAPLSLTNSQIALGAAIAYSKLNLSGSITDSDIALAAAIAYSKLNLANSIVNADISATAAIVYSKLNLANSIVNSDISSSAAIDYVKLNLTNAIVNGDISPSAAIAYSKLDLVDSIVNGDISATAAIARNKLATGLSNRLVVNDSSGVMTDASAITANRALVSDANGIPTHSPTTAAEIASISGINVAAHAARHLPSGADPLTTASAVDLNADSVNAEGTNDSFARSDHTHAIGTGVPVSIGTANFAGADPNLARADHVHNHGNQSNPSHHAIATVSANGFMSSVDKTKLDASTSLNTPSTLVQRDTSGNFSAGTITATLNGTANDFSGSLIGDVTGTQTATVVSSVGGKTSAEVSTSVDDTIAATSANTPATIVKRDSNGDFVSRFVNILRTVFRDSGSNTITVQAPTTVSASYTLNLPDTQGISGTYLTNDGAGNLSWSSPLINIDGGRPDTVFVVGGNINGGTP